jgi:hypothetical protein
MKTPAAVDLLMHAGSTASSFGVRTILLSAENDTIDSVGM